MKGKNYILTIAIDKYFDKKITPLYNAKFDAENIQNALIDNYDFDIFEAPLFDENATRENIVNVLNHLSTSVLPVDNVIIYFAGHGIIHTKSDVGYWVPYDAKQNSAATFINNSTIIDSLRAIEAKHLFLVSDSCFSGSFISSSRFMDSEKHYLRLNEKSSRWILTSGRNEIVSDGQPQKGSPFANAFLSFLVKNKEKYFSLTELSNSVTKETSQVSNQQPVFAPLIFFKNEGGQMVFRLKPDSGRSNRGWEAKFEEFCNSKDSVMEWPHISQNNPKTKSLGRWCMDQRSLKRAKKLSLERERRLIEAGFVFNPYVKKFYAGFGKFMAFMHETGYSYVPGHLTKQFNEEAAWLKVQQTRYKRNPCNTENPQSYPKYRYDLLVKNGISIHTNSVEDLWDKFCEDLEDFYQKNEKYVTIPSQTSKDENIRWLGNCLNDYMVSWKRKKLAAYKVAFISKYVDKDYLKNKRKRDFQYRLDELKKFQAGDKNKTPLQGDMDITGLGQWYAQIKSGLKEGTSRNIPEWKLEILKREGLFNL